MRPSDGPLQGGPDETQGLPAFHDEQTVRYIGMIACRRREHGTRRNAFWNWVNIRIGRVGLRLPQMIHKNDIGIFLQQNNTPTMFLERYQHLNHGVFRE